MNKLLEHFKRMQECVSAYIEPAPYVARTGDTAGETATLAQSNYRNMLFMDDIIYLADGPEQREAEASVGNTYIEDALRTESALMAVSGERNDTNRLLHAAMGLTTEAGEFLDALKKHLFYGKPLDLVNLREEIGDIMWYLAIACDALGTDFETEQERNIAKLRKRYPEKFDAEQAIERDLDAERAILEK